MSPTHQGAEMLGTDHEGIAPEGIDRQSLDQDGTDAALDDAAASGTQVIPDQRLLSAWRQWLGALAKDAEAAHAAAMAYKQLDAAAREVWVDALAQDAAEAGVPKIAVYAPLLAVETDPARRQRIQAALRDEGGADLGGKNGLGDEPGAPRAPIRALCSGDASGLRVIAIVMPLYLDFVQVLACGYYPGQRFEWVRHDPILLSGHAPRAGAMLEANTMETRPLRAVIDELAATVVAHRRNGLELPAALEVLSELFVPFGGEGEPESL